jgi:hypothetical protein
VTVVLVSVGLGLGKHEVATLPRLVLVVNVMPGEAKLVPAYLLVIDPGAVAVTLMVTAGGVKLEPPAIGPGMDSSTFDPTRAAEPDTVPPEALVETNVELAGTGMIIFMVLMLFTVTPTADDGTVDEPGAMVMATADPAVTEPGAVPVTEVVMLDVEGMGPSLPWQLQLTLTAAFAVPAKQSAAANAIGVMTPARSSVEFDRIVVSKE